MAGAVERRIAECMIWIFFLNHASMYVFIVSVYVSVWGASTGTVTELQREHFYIQEM